jgi:peptidyl-prolyl cis-trans isomerase B (cyclophilin B)
MKNKIWSWLKPLLILSLLGGLVLGGCSALQADSVKSSTPTSTTEETSIKAQTNVPQPNLPRLEGKAKVELTINGSPIIIEVDGNEAPITAGNFVDLVQRGVYDGLVFHRVVKDPQPFVAQGGDPQGKDPKFPASQLGTGSFIDPETSKARYIPLEIKVQGEENPTYSRPLGRQTGSSAPPAVVLKHTRSAVAMARSQPPDSASSQFYIALADLDFLDGDYAVFGYVTKGMDAVDRINQGDRIQSAKVIEGAENLKK